MWRDLCKFEAFWGWIWGAGGSVMGFSGVWCEVGVIWLAEARFPWGYAWEGGVFCREVPGYVIVWIYRSGRVE